MEIKMANRNNVVLRPRVGVRFEGIHPDVDIAAVFFVFVPHPILKGRSGDFVDGADALDGLAPMAVPDQYGDAIRGLKIGADIFRGRRVLVVLRFPCVHGLPESLWKMAQWSNRSASG